jgi:hypothetical protein
MDNKFLEFWGQSLIQMAKGQKQYEDMLRRTTQGLAGFEEIAVFFRKCYGLDKTEQDPPDYLQNLSKTAEHLRKSYDDYLNFIGMVPKNEHIRLIKKYEELKEKTAAQEETIRHLKMLLDNKTPEQGEIVDKYKELLKNQKDQFQQLMVSIQKFYQTSAKEEEKNS